MDYRVIEKRYRNGRGYFDGKINIRASDWDLRVKNGV